MKELPLLVLTMALVSLVVSPAVRAATFQHNTVFDASFDATLTGPFVGTGTLTYDAATALPNGSYDLASFTALTLFLDFPTVPTGFNLGILPRLRLR